MLKFTDERIKKFASGRLRFTNTGEPFTVASAALESALLKEITILDGERVLIFERAEAVEEETPKRKRKGAVVAEAENKGIETTPDAQTIEEIENKIKEKENANR